jgi:hypothetical protein
MLNLSAATRAFVALSPVDLRGSFNRLSALAQIHLAQDPLSGICLSLPTGGAGSLSG